MECLVIDLNYIYSLSFSPMRNFKGWVHGPFCEFLVPFPSHLYAIMAQGTWTAVLGGNGVYSLRKGGRRGSSVMGGETIIHAG